MVFRCGGGDDDFLPRDFWIFWSSWGTGIEIQMVGEDKAMAYLLLLVSYLQTRRLAGVGICLFIFIFTNAEFVFTPHVTV